MQTNIPDSWDDDYASLWQRYQDTQERLSAQRVLRATFEEKLEKAETVIRRVRDVRWNEDEVYDIIEQYFEDS